jgi:hypothetical protein
MLPLGGAGSGLDLRHVGSPVQDDILQTTGTSVSLRAVRASGLPIIRGAAHARSFFQFPGYSAART